MTGPAGLMDLFDEGYEAGRRPALPVSFCQEGDDVGAITVRNTTLLGLGASRLAFCYPSAAIFKLRR